MGNEWVKQVEPMASAEASYPPGTVRRVSDEDERGRLITAGFVVPCEPPSERAVEESDRVEKAVASATKARKKRSKK